jgi:hypothetical protein
MSQFFVSLPKQIAFGNNQGVLIINDGKLRFEGDADESAKILFDGVVRTFNEHINQAVLAEREACAKLCEGKTMLYGSMANKCAAAIRQRGEK